MPPFVGDSVTYVKIIMCCLQLELLKDLSCASAQI